MELEIYTAFRKAGIEDADARAVVESINKEIDRRYSMHSQQLATRGDMLELRGSVEAKIAQAQTEIIKWCMGSIFAAVALFASIIKIWQ